jgi:hypothetical protein
MDIGKQQPTVLSRDPYLGMLPCSYNARYSAEEMLYARQDGGEKSFDTLGYASVTSPMMCSASLN